MIVQKQLKLKMKPRGFHLITEEILSQVKDLPQAGIMNLFIQHTSAALTINENADPSVRRDFEEIYKRLIPENQDYYTHTSEGPDDMPSHVKSTLTGASLNIPIENKKLALGTWQGIYLCEFRNHGGPRKILVTIYS